MSMQWLLAKAPGFQALPEADRAAMFNFTFLCDRGELHELVKVGFRSNPSDRLRSAFRNVEG